MRSLYSFVNCFTYSKSIYLINLTFVRASLALVRIFFRLYKNFTFLLPYYVGANFLLAVQYARKSQTNDNVRRRKDVVRRCRNGFRVLSRVDVFATETIQARYSAEPVMLGIIACGNGAEAFMIPAVD